MKEGPRWVSSCSILEGMKPQKATEDRDPICYTREGHVELQTRQC